MIVGANPHAVERPESSSRGFEGPPTRFGSLDDLPAARAHEASSCRISLHLDAGRQNLSSAKVRHSLQVSMMRSAATIPHSAQTESPAAWSSTMFVLSHEVQTSSALTAHQPHRCHARSSTCDERRAKITQNSKRTHDRRALISPRINVMLGD